MKHEIVFQLYATRIKNVDKGIESSYPGSWAKKYWSLVKRKLEFNLQTYMIDQGVVTLCDKHDYNQKITVAVFTGLEHRLVLQQAENKKKAKD